VVAAHGSRGERGGVPMTSIRPTTMGAGAP
jgi:hypothetical protein